ncbi:nitrate reductase molybdenum cofactor assembly chaperone [Uliginosibacterium gangwonense]|uniref:nitrate reductase molybdenum cofactor assembly chaperone n=1 Tax=Uliginosibacterium gangwonense TaxID=392736 RepID=UPI00037A65B9|nr:nitrate reductase molybdenum cofactor assembly chaperone [Uliginosibacterium gangwonense]
MSHSQISPVTLRTLSALLTYPEQDLLDALDELQLAVPEEHALPLLGLFTYLRTHDLVRLQENYVDTFDRNPSHSLHLFEHIHGESRDRGQAMVDLLEEYRCDGFEPTTTELPDYVPLFLEFLSVVTPERAQGLLDDAIHVLAAVGGNLSKNGSPYALVFNVVQGMSGVVPVPLASPPVRDMDEALEVFGTGADGVEPLLKPQTTHTLQFHAQRPPATARI